MKFVITGASTYGVSNMGDDGMLVNLVQGLRRSYPDCQITFLARHIDKKYDEIFGIHSIQNLDHDSKKESEGRFFFGMNKGDDGKNLHAISEAIRDADLLIIGGNSFMEIFDNQFLRGVSSYSSTLAMLSKFHNTPYALFGVNVVDEIREQTTIQHAKFVCENATSITMREQTGKDYLLAVGVSDQNFYVLGDPVYGIEVETKKYDLQKILALDDIEFQGKPIIGVGLRHEYWKRSEAEYINTDEQIAKLLDDVIEELDCEILFIPNCTYTKGHKWQDDRVTHRDIHVRMKKHDMAYCIEQELSVFETYSLFTLLDMHISNRRHSCIFAAMNDVPFVSLDADWKGHMSPFLLDLGIPSQMGSLNDLEGLNRKIIESWKNKSSISEVVRSNVKNLAAKSYTHVSTILNDSF